jgi:hypothetical protein
VLVQIIQSSPVKGALLFKLAANQLTTLAGIEASDKLEQLMVASLSPRGQVCCPSVNGGAKFWKNPTLSDVTLVLEIAPQGQLTSDNLAMPSIYASLDQCPLLPAVNRRCSSRVHVQRLCDHPGRLIL